MTAPEEIEAAHQFLRGHTTGDLRFGEHLRPLRYVIAPDGRLVAPVMYAMLDAVDTVLFVPGYTEGAMEVQVTLSALDPRGAEGALADRWRIYHGDPQDVLWARMDVDAARFRAFVVDGETLMRPNPLATGEPRLLREINGGRRDDLRRLCRHFAGADVETPLLVGVDPQGFDVKRRFDVIRVPAPTPMETPDAVEALFSKMCQAAPDP